MTSQKFIIELRDEEEETIDDLGIFLEEVLEDYLPDGLSYQLLELEPDDEISGER